MRRSSLWLVSLLAGCSTGRIAAGNPSASPDADSRDGGGGAFNQRDSGSSFAGAGDGNSDPPIVRHPSPCPTTDAPTGAWEDITPGAVNLSEPTFGVQNFVIDPQDSSIITLGTDKMGIYRSSDCGANWTKIDTGRNHELLDQGAQWSMVIDPQDPDVIYANSGYGPSGLYKSTNGGVDWDPIFSKEVTDAFIYGGFIQYINIDPTNHLHLTVNPHFECVGAHAGVCIAETEDGGETWKLKDGAPPSGEGAAFEMEDHDTWYWSRGFGGLYRTDNAGLSWDLVAQKDGYAYDHFVKTANGARYFPAAFSVITSQDGINWRNLENSPGAQIILGTDRNLLAMNGACVSKQDATTTPLWAAPVNEPTSWKQIDDGPPLKWGPGYLAYDKDHQLLYLAACRAGIWRVHMEL